MRSKKIELSIGTKTVFSIKMKHVRELFAFFAKGEIPEESNAFMLWVNDNISSILDMSSDISESEFDDLYPDEVDELLNTVKELNSFLVEKLTATMNKASVETQKVTTKIS